jgi:hypothetical protein
VVDVSVSGLDDDSPLAAVAVVVAGLAIGGFGVYDHVRVGDALGDAVEVEATVLGTDVEASPSGSAGTDYRAEVRFEYEFRGESYTSGNLFPSSFDPTYDTQGEAESALDGIEPGGTVTAFVDPASPGEAFLRERRSNASLVLVGVGAVFVVVGIRRLL